MPDAENRNRLSPRRARLESGEGSSASTRMLRTRSNWGSESSTIGGVAGVAISRHSPTARNSTPRPGPGAQRTAGVGADHHPPPQLIAIGHVVERPQAEQAGADQRHQGRQHPARRDVQTAQPRHAREGGVQRQQHHAQGGKHRRLLPVDALEQGQGGGHGQQRTGGAPGGVEPLAKSEGDQDEHQPDDAGHEVADLDHRQGAHDRPASVAVRDRRAWRRTPAASPPAPRVSSAINVGATTRAAGLTSPPLNHRVVSRPLLLREERADYSAQLKDVASRVGPPVHGSASLAAVRRGHGPPQRACPVRPQAFRCAPAARSPQGGSMSSSSVPAPASGKIWSEGSAAVLRRQCVRLDRRRGHESSPAGRPQGRRPEFHRHRRRLFSLGSRPFRR